MLNIESYNNNIVLPKIKQQMNIQMDKQYEKDGLLVKIYSPKLPENMRIKKNTELKQKIAEIVSNKVF